MPRVGLSAYRVVIHDLNADASWVFRHGTLQDGIGALARYVKDRHQRTVRLGRQLSDGSYADNRAIRLIKHTVDRDAKSVWGVFLKGEGGIQREIWNVDSEADVPAYTTKPSDAMLTPLYFRIVCPEGATHGVALLQSFGSDAMKGHVEDDLANHLRLRDPKATCKFKQLINENMLKAFAEQGKLQDVYLIYERSSQGSRDLMEKQVAVAGESLNHKGDMLEVRVHKKGGFDAKSLATLMQRKKQGRASDAVVIPIKEAPDDLVVEIELDKKKKKFSLLNPDDSPYRVDITDDVKIGPNGYPTADSVHKAADEVWKTIQGMVY